jgi:hypothetical protein
VGGLRCHFSILLVAGCFPCSWPLLVNRSGCRSGARVSNCYLLNVTFSAEDECDQGPVRFCLGFSRFLWLNFNLGYLSIIVVIFLCSVNIFLRTTAAVYSFSSYFTQKVIQFA